MANTTELKIIRLMTGEEIIGSVTDKSDYTITVKNPVRVVVIPTNDQTTPKVGFAPFTQWSDDKELTLNRSHVTFIATPITEFVNQYNGMFGGLVLPKSEIIKP
jgi:hypothetical protein